MFGRLGGMEDGRDLETLGCWLGQVGGGMEESVDCQEVPRTSKEGKGEESDSGRHSFCDVGSPSCSLLPFSSPFWAHAPTLPSPCLFSFRLPPPLVSLTHMHARQGLRKGREARDYP